MLSKYNVYYKNENVYFIYHTFSRKIVFVNENQYAKILENYEKLDHDTYSRLCEYGMIVQEGKENNRYIIESYNNPMKSPER